MNVFQMLVLGIVAVVLVYLVAGFFGFLPNDNLEEIKEMLKEGKVLDEEMIEKELSFRNGEVFSQNSFIEKDLSVEFSCLGSDCSEIEWDSEKISFEKDLHTSVYVKCKDNEFEYRCLIGFGEKPGYLELLDYLIFAEDGKVRIYYKIENSGSEDLFQILLSLDGIEIYEYNGMWKEGEYKIGKSESLELLGSGEIKEGYLEMECLELEDYWDLDSAEKKEKCILNKNYNIEFKIEDYKYNGMKREGKIYVEK